MCGITGVFAKSNLGRNHFEKIPYALLKLKQRGPDFSSTYGNDNYMIAHARLSIFDISSASNQPFVSEDGRFAMVFNGEVFNFIEIRKKLERINVFCKTSGDVEVVLKAYIHFGTKCFSLFNGFFAIAIFDTEENTLTLARDRFGVKPLIYYSNSEAVIFASEMKAMLAYSVNKDIDKQSIYEYFRLTYIPEPNSIFTNIKKLAPGHFAVFSKDKSSFFSYYQIKNKHFEGSYKDACVSLQNILESSVKLRLESDVPIGSFLSGGIDSSIISVLSAKNKSNFQTYTISFPDTPYYDEAGFAKEIAKKHGLNNTIIPILEQDFISELPSTLDYIDEPFADSSSIAFKALSAFVRKYVTVALSGDGADEIFGGYRKHRASAILAGANLFKLNSLRLSSMLPNVFGRNNPISDKLRKLRRLGAAASYSNIDRYLYLAAFHSKKEIANLLKSPYISTLSRLEGITNNKDIDDLNQILKNDVNIVLLSDILRKSDLMSMAESIEVRSPFLDYRLVDFAFSLPASWKFDSKRTKKILIDSYSNILPKNIMQRPKQGFEVPIGKWLNGMLLKQIEEEWFDEKFIINQDIFNHKFIKILLNEIKLGRGMQKQSLIWSIIVFQNWWKKYAGL